MLAVILLPRYHYSLPQLGRLIPGPETALDLAPQTTAQTRLARRDLKTSGENSSRIKLPNSSFAYKHNCTAVVSHGQVPFQSDNMRYAVFVLVCCEKRGRLQLTVLSVVLSKFQVKQ